MVNSTIKSRRNGKWVSGCLMAVVFFWIRISGRLFATEGNCLDQQSMKQTFMMSAVRVIARDGLVKATTKAIAAEAGLNEALIYRCFSSKNELLSAAFYQEDENFTKLLYKTLPVMCMPDFAWKERAFLLWKQSWEFILKNEADCIFYIRYYYSADCRAQAYDTHLKHFHALIEKVRPAFKPGTNVDMLVHQIFDTMLAFATRVLNGEMENSEATTQWIFEQICSFVVPNVRAEVLGEEGKEEAI